MGCLCSPRATVLVAIPFQAGMTALQAVEASGLQTQVSLPEPLQLGIFGAKAEACDFASW